MPPGSNSGAGGHVQRIYDNMKRIVALEGQVSLPANTIVVNSPDDVPAPVGDLITLNDSEVPLAYIFNQAIDWGNLRFTGRNVWCIGAGNLTTFQSTASASAMFSSSGPGFMVLEGMICSNGAGPFLDIDLQNRIDSGLLLERTFFFGDPGDMGFGVGSLGRIVNANRVSFQNCFFQGLLDGITLEGTIGQVNISNTDIESRLAGVGFTAIKTNPTASIDIFTVRDNRFNLRSASDFVHDLSLAATYLAPVQFANNFSRGIGSWAVPASMTKGNPMLIMVNNDGATAPVNSAWFGEANFNLNTTQTVIAAPNVPVPIGNGAPLHSAFNFSTFAERFTIEGVQTQNQVFRYIGVRSRVFELRLEMGVDRVGIVTQTHQSGLRVNGVALPESLFDRAIPFADGTLISSAVVTLDPGDTVGHQVANLTQASNIVVKSAKLLAFGIT